MKPARRPPLGIDYHKALAIPDNQNAHAIVAIRMRGNSLLLQPVCPLRLSLDIARTGVASSLHLLQTLFISQST